MFAFVYVVTEGLSLFSALTRENVLICWGLFIVLIGVIIFVNRNNLKGFVKNYSVKISNKSALFKFQIMLVVILVAVMFTMSANIVPYNGDSMAYHLPRVMHWVQNKSVSYYITNDGRQLYSPPFAEYCVLQVYFLFGTDKFFNLVQWYSYVTSACVIFCVLRKRNVSQEFSMLGCILFLTMPIAIAESTTTQTDLVASMFLMFFIYIAIDLIESECLALDKDSIVRIAMCATSIGIGYLTKSQVCIVMIPFLCWLAISRLIKKDRIVDLLLFLIMAVAIVGIFVCPGMVRNVHFVDDPFAMSYFSDISIGTYNPKYVLANIVKNWATSSLSQASPAINSVLLLLVRFIVGRLGIDIDDVRINFGQAFYSVFSPSYECDFASAPYVGIAYALSIVLIIILLFRKKISNNTIFEVVLGLSVVPSFVMIRWQIWVSRLLLPSFAVMTIFIILVLFECEEWLDKWQLKRTVVIMMTVVMMFSAWSVVDYHKTFFNNSREYEDRNKMYFTANLKAYDGFCELVEYVDTIDARVLGIDSGTEYQIWHVLKNEDNIITTVFSLSDELIDKFNINRDVIHSLQEKQQVPDIIIADGNDELGAKRYYLNQGYRCVWNDSTGEYCVYAMFE